MVTPDWKADEPGTPAAVWRRDPHYASAHGCGPSLEGVRRLVVVSAHPDDESLGAGGLVATATGAGIAVTLVCATDGEGSHPDSPSTSPSEMGRRRRSELRVAAGALGVEEEHVDLLGMPDGRLAAHTGDLVVRLVELVGDGRDTVIAAPSRFDGHPDHEAVGTAAATAARRTGATLWEYPVWFWHWASPQHPDWARLRPLRFSEDAVRAKRLAVAAHATQVAPLSGQPGDEVVLPPGVLEHFAGDLEHFVVTPGLMCDDAALDDLHRDEEDPWGVETRWYEERKRSLLLAVLPGRRYRHGLEVGCSTGVLTEALAARCERLTAIDHSAFALERARARLKACDGVTTEHADVPREWPVDDQAPEACDLVVVSEVGYFLSPVALEGLVERIRRTVSPDGVLVLCHWRHDVAGWPLDSEAVHAAFLRCGLPVQATYQDRDVEIRVHAVDSTWPDPDR